MNKTITINIAGIIFNIEEDAYAKLKEYLDSVKAYFLSNAEHDEIVADIEARAAEHFSQNLTGAKIITLAHVDSLISVMGTVEEFAREGEQEKNAPKETVIKRRLFRDGENKILGGVSAGLGAYFDVDPLVFRLLFIFSTLFMGGFGLLVYIVLFIVMPEAKTATDRLQMRGGPIDLQSLKKNFDAQMKVVKENTGTVWGKLKNFVGGVLEFVGITIKILLKIVGGFAGVIVAGVTFFGILFSTFIFANLLANANTPLIQFPLSRVATGWEYVSIVVLAYFLVLIPLFFLLLCAISLLRRKNSITLPVVLALGGVWIAAVMGAGVMGIRFGPEYAQKIKALPEYQTVEKSFAVGDFNSLVVEGVDAVIFEAGPTSSVTVAGVLENVQNTSLSVESGVLTISRKPSVKTCLFCFNNHRNRIVVKGTGLESVKIAGAASLASEEIFASSTVSVAASGVSRVSLTVSSTKTVVEQEGAARVTLSGKTDTLKVDLSGVSFLNASDLHARAVEARQYGSSNSWVLAESILFEGGGTSRLHYSGNPTVTSTESGHAKIEAAEEWN